MKLCTQPVAAVSNKDVKAEAGSGSWKRKLEAEAVEAGNFLWKRKHFDVRDWKRKRTRKQLILSD